MGANAVTSVYDFTAGQILTAAQMDQVNCGVPVFATTTTRDAAFGGTGERTLAQGQYAYIEATNTLQQYSGTAWQSASAMYVVKATTTFATSAAVLVDSVFTTAYDTYLIVAEGTAAANDAVFLNWRVGGATNTASNYNYQYMSANGATIGGNNATGGTFAYIGDWGTTRSAFSVLVQTPATAAPTTTLSQSNRNGNFMYSSISSFTGSTAFDGFTFKGQTQNISGQYTVYGMSKAI
jgi:hypothetical protein